MNTTTPPPLASQSLILRCFVPEDAPRVHAMSRESSLRAWLPDEVYESEARAREVLLDLIDSCRDPGSPARGPYVLGVCLKRSFELIGHVGLSPLGRAVADRLGVAGHGGDREQEADVEVGYSIEEKHQGRGFASEAVGAMVEWALRRFSLPRVLGIVFKDNAASCRVLEHAGFAMVGEKMDRLNGRPGLIRTYERVRQAGAEDGRRATQR